MRRSPFSVEAREPACEPVKDIANGSVGFLATLTYSLPVTIRLPLIASAMIFVAAVVSTQTAIFFMSRQVEQHAETLGQVYLDGLSAALLPHVRDGNRAGTSSVLEYALRFHQGVVDRRLVFLDTKRNVVANAQRDESDSELPPEIGREESGGLLTDAGDSIWVWRSLYDGRDRLGTVVANLDISDFYEARQRLRWSLLLFDLVFSGVCAVIGFFMVRRLQQPITILARHLYDAALGQARPIEREEMPKVDRQTSQIFHAFNAMAHATQEREALLSHLADKERDAVLGRLVATIAHEVRNPLAGMRTAIGTLRQYGDRIETRGEAVEFLERGVRVLEEVVDATLESHRVRPRWRSLSRRDFDDLRLLVQADGRSRGVLIEADLKIPGELPLAALEIRQVVLNLLLNAIRASSSGGAVRLSAAVEEGELVVSVRDQGSGLDLRTARAMETGASTDDAPGLGVAVVIRLVERLQGRVAVESQPGSGTSITLFFPLKEHLTE